MVFGGKERGPDCPLELHERTLIPRRKLGEGGVGQTWLVKDLDSAEDLVLKVLHGNRRVLSLARLAIEESIAHQSQIQRGTRVQRIRSDVSVWDTVLYDYIPGDTLAEKMLVPAEVPVIKRIGMVRSCLESSLDVWADLAQQNLVHNDVRPENMVQGSDGNVHWIDGDFLGRSGRRPTKSLHGPVWYTSPEVLGAEPSATSDLFSLGVTGFTYVAGGVSGLPSATVLSAERTRMEFSEAPSTFAHLSSAFTALDEFDPELLEFLMRTVRRNPKDRPQSLAECREILRRS